MDLTLLVIRSAIPELLAEFYTLLGVTFEYHRHGTGPYHYSTYIGPTLLEIYPLTKHQEKADLSLRLGFSIESFDSVIQLLQQRSVVVHQAPTDTTWGVMAIVTDPEERKIELYKK